MKITTKTGDGGETSLFGGRRVSKASDFIELVGQLDELQAYVGWCRCVVDGFTGEGIGASQDLQIRNLQLLNRVQDDLYRMMSVVGFEMKCPANVKPIDEEDVKFFEGYAEKAQEEVGNLSKFIRPGTTEAAARLHIARTVCRRVEREFVRASVGGENILKYLNRLSDVLFIMAYSYEKD